MSVGASDSGLAGWTWDLPGLGVVVVAAVGYALGVRRVRRHGGSWRLAPTLAWAAGVAVLVVATVGWVGAHAGLLFWDWVLQVLLLLLVAPVLLLCGRPVQLAVGGLDARGGARVLAVTRSRPLRVLASPLLGPLVVPIVLGAVVFTPVLPSSLASSSVAAVLHGVLLFLGLVIALGLVGDGGERETSLALGAAVAVGVVELLVDAVPGIALRLRTQLLAAPYWTAVGRPQGPSPLSDQQHAGAVLWFVAEAADLPLLVLLLRRWVRADAREAARADALDDGETAAASNPGAGPSAPAAPRGVAGHVPFGGSEDSQPVLQRPWWETDPGRLGGHRVARAARRQRDG